MNFPLYILLRDLLICIIICHCDKWLPQQDRSLLLRIGVQLVVSYTAIEAQVVFETLLVLVTGQLAITGQLGRKVYP